jgi:hypothetical protein
MDGNFLVFYLQDSIYISKRYLPEVMATLLGTLQLCVPQLEDNEQFPTMSFPISRPHREIFCIRTKVFPVFVLILVSAQIYRYWTIQS